MSKEFERWFKANVGISVQLAVAANVRDVQLLKDCADYFRALGRREVKGEAADVAFDLLVDGITWGHDGNCGSPEIVRAAIEAIPEEG